MSLCCEAGDCEPRLCPENKLRLRFKAWLLEAAAMLTEDEGCLFGTHKLLLRMLLKAAWPRVNIPSVVKELRRALDVDAAKPSYAERHLGAKAVEG